MKRKLTTKINELYDRNSCYLSKRLNQIFLMKQIANSFCFTVNNLTGVCKTFQFPSSLFTRKDFESVVHFSSFFSNLITISHC